MKPLLIVAGFLLFLALTTITCGEDDHVTALNEVSAEFAGDEKVAAMCGRMIDVLNDIKSAMHESEGSVASNESTVPRLGYFIDYFRLERSVGINTESILDAEIIIRIRKRMNKYQFREADACVYSTFVQRINYVLEEVKQCNTKTFEEEDLEKAKEKCIENKESLKKELSWIHLLLIVVKVMSQCLQKDQNYYDVGQRFNSLDSFPEREYLNKRMNNLVNFVLFMHSERDEKDVPECLREFRKNLIEDMKSSGFDIDTFIETNKWKDLDVYLYYVQQYNPSYLKALRDFVSNDERSEEKKKKFSEFVLRRMEEYFEAKYKELPSTA